VVLRVDNEPTSQSSCPDICTAARYSDSDRPLETMLDEFKRLKDEYPDRILIASIMEVTICLNSFHRQLTKCS
jgi:hypothetical protein